MSVIRISSGDDVFRRCGVLPYTRSDVGIVIDPERRGCRCERPIQKISQVDGVAAATVGTVRPIDEGVVRPIDEADQLRKVGEGASGGGAAPAGCPSSLWGNRYR